jgi:hypothetical protein
MKFQDYRLRYRRKLRDFRFHMEKAVNEFGTRCLPFPGKSSTLGDMIGWFDNEIQALLDTVAKANKNFVCFAIVGVLQMLYANGCDHVEGFAIVGVLDSGGFARRIGETHWPPCEEMVDRIWFASCCSSVQ